jgi:hypothetical protein
MLFSGIEPWHVPTANRLGFGYSFGFLDLGFGFGGFGVWIVLGFGFGVSVLVFFSDYCNEAIHRASQTSHSIARVKKTSLY